VEVQHHAVHLVGGEFVVFTREMYKRHLLG
jgi:hypothetical protein